MSDSCNKTALYLDCGDGTQIYTCDKTAQN